MNKNSAYKFLIYFFTGILALMWIMPLAIAIMNAVKVPKDFYTGTIWTLPVRTNILQNISDAWIKAGLKQGFSNSIFYGIVSSVCAIFFAALAAFALTTLKVKWPLFWFLLIYSGTVFPLQTYLIPLFTMFSKINLYDTKLGLSLYYTAISIPFCLFVLRNYFLTYSKEIVEASRLDGSSDLRIFLQMYMPMAKSPIMVLLLFQFTFIWNDLLFSMTLSRSAHVRSIMTGLSNLQGAYSTSNIPVLLTAAVIASIPTLLLFVFLQKHFMKGFVLGAVR